MSRCHILPKLLMDLRWARTWAYQQKKKKNQRTATVICVVSDEQLPELHEHLSVANQTAADSAHARQGAVRRDERNWTQLTIFKHLTMRRRGQSRLCHSMASIGCTSVLISYTGLSEKTSGVCRWIPDLIWDVRCNHWVCCNSNNALQILLFLASCAYTLFVTVCNSCILSVLVCTLSAT